MFPSTILKLVRPNMIVGPWIAGGAARHFYEGTPLNGSDVDVYCSSKSQFDELVTQLGDSDFSHIAATPNALTYKDRDKTIQLIQKRFPANYKDVVKGFDLTVCQFVTDGKKVWATEEAKLDLENKRLRFVPGNTRSIGRLIKYYTYGFVPDQEVWDQLVTEPSTFDWTHKQDEYD